MPLTGCQLCTTPAYRLPQSFGQACPVAVDGELDPVESLQLAGAPWEFDAFGSLRRFVTLQGETATASDFDEDARLFEAAFARDVRSLHGHNHNHDCTTTCIKYQKKKAAEELANLLSMNKAPPCRFLFFRKLILLLENDDGKERRLRIRRRGKELVHTPYVANTNDHNEYGLAQVERPMPFRSPSSDLVQAGCRCNGDLRYMPRGFPSEDGETVKIRCDARLLAACFRAVSFKRLEEAAVRRMAYSVVAIYVAAHNCDYYITKYRAKPMEQLQNLVTQYALGLRRLEDEEAKETTPTTPAARARRVVNRLNSAANRSSWVSCTELALYVHTEQAHWQTHKNVPTLLTRGLWLIHECRRLLEGRGNAVLSASEVPINVISFSSHPHGAELASRDDSGLSAPHRDASQLAVLPRSAPAPLPNIGDTCFWNSLVQCWRQTLKTTS